MDPELSLIIANQALVHASLGGVCAICVCVRGVIPFLCDPELFVCVCVCVCVCVFPQRGICGYVGVITVCKANSSSFIMDPFVGTGSLLLTCSAFGARTIGFDIDPRILRGIIKGRGLCVLEKRIMT